MEDKMSLEIKIVNATINIFKEKGVKFTMDDLANNLGVSKRTLYENIDSKETLLNLIQLQKREKKYLMMLPLII